MSQRRLSLVVHRLSAQLLSVAFISLCFATETIAAGPTASLPASQADAGRQAALDEAIKLNDRFLTERAAGRYREALEAGRKSLEIRQRLLGDQHFDTLISLNNVGMGLWDVGDRSTGVTYLRESLRLRRQSLGEKHRDTALALQNLGALLDAMDEDCEATTCFEQALAIRQELLGESHADTLLTLNNLGMLLKKMGDLATARACLERSMTLHTKVFGEEHSETALAMNNLACVLDDLGDYEAAQPLYERALAVRRKILGNRHLDTALSMANLAYLLNELGRRSQAEAYYQDALAVRRELLGENHSLTVATSNALRGLAADASAARPHDDGLDARQRAQLALAQRLNNRVVAHKRAGRYHEALDAAERAYAIRKEVLGAEHLTTLISLNNLGVAQWDLGKPDIAVTHFRELLRLYRQLVGDRHLDTALALTNLGGCLSDLGQYAEARACLEQSLLLRKELLGERHLDSILTMNNLGLLIERAGDYVAARSHLERSLTLRKEVFGEKSCEVALGLNNLAALLVDMGDYAAARPLYEQALAIRRELLGPRHHEVAMSMNNLGLLLVKLGNYAQARVYYEQALEIDRQALSETHPDLATELNNLGHLSAASGEGRAAIDYYQQALAIWTRSRGDSHPDTLLALHNIGSQTWEVGDALAARDYLRRAVAGRKHVLGENHPNVALSLDGLGCALAELGEDAAAWTSYEEAAAIRSKALGEDHPSTAISLANLAWLYEATGRGAQGVEFEDRARRVVRQHVARVLNGLSETEQLKFLYTADRGPFHTALSHALARREEPTARRLSAGWLLNGKAVAQESLTERTRLVRDAHDPNIASVIEQLLAVRRQLAATATAAPVAGGADARRLQLDQLAAREQELARKMAQLSRRPLPTNAWVELDDVRQKIPQQAVLIDLARFDVLDFQVRARAGRWRPARYAAWIVPPADRGDVELVDLGEAATIDAAIERVKIGLSQATKRCREVGEQEAERELRVELSQLADLVWKPLTPFVAAAKKIVISPDSSLWLVPWAALPVGNGRYLVEDVELQYVVSGRDLLAAPDAFGPMRPSLIVADPDFDLQPGEARTELRKILPQFADLVPDGGRGAVLTTSLPRVSRLPGTALEASLIAPNLQRYVHLAPDVRTDREALEEVVKVVQGPEVVVLSTHGYFLPDQAANTQGLRLENPLLRCGLLLAGCNQSHAAGQDDGVLTGLEIVGLDLRGTRLVVLSACETGVGQVCNGEGVAGLRQAFLLAGAQNVVATLWQVPDRQSVQLMNAFFEGLASGLHATDALRQAQTSLIAARRERFEGAHPFFWAAFTVTGP